MDMNADRHETALTDQNQSGNQFQSRVPPLNFLLGGAMRATRCYATFEEPTALLEKMKMNPVIVPNKLIFLEINGQW